MSKTLQKKIVIQSGQAGLNVAHSTQKSRMQAELEQGPHVITVYIKIMKVVYYLHGQNGHHALNLVA